MENPNTVVGETPVEAAENLAAEINDSPETISVDDFDESLTGIPKEVIEKWKKYGNVFSIYFIDQQYIYRNFTYPEYKALRKTIREAYPQDMEAGDDAFKEEIQKMCVIWPAPL